MVLESGMLFLFGSTYRSWRHEMKRCDWSTSDLIYIQYHDNEWGVPVHDDTKLFEFLILEGAQAGLSWLTILKRREGYRQAFQDYNPEIIARYSQSDVETLMNNPGIIRNRLKINAAVTNARAFLNVQEAFGSFDAYSWQFVDGRQKINTFKRIEELPASTRESEAFSKDLKQRGFKFVGPTIIYAHMQATGMVNDHLVSCFRYEQVMEQKKQND